MDHSAVLFTLCLSFVIFSSCTTPRFPKDNILGNMPIGKNPDTLTGKKTIAGELAGAAYRKRATGYFVIVNGDSSGFMPVFTESNADGMISIYLNLPYSNKTETYARRLEELKMILQASFGQHPFKKTTRHSPEPVEGRTTNES